MGARKIKNGGKKPVVIMINQPGTGNKNETKKQLTDSQQKLLITRHTMNNSNSELRSQ